MSAFEVHHEHINVLLWAADRFQKYRGDLTWEYGNPTWQGRLDHSTASRNETGQMLVEANIASLNHRYKSGGQAPQYRYANPRHMGWTVGEVLNALHCYQHQSDETPDWATSQAHQFCRTLEELLIRAVPGYQDGPWAITPASRPPNTSSM